MIGVVVSKAPQIMRYGLVGVLALLVDVACFAVLRALTVDLIAANAAARLAGAATAFLGNNGWTFNASWRASNLRVNAARYWSLWVVTTVISTFVLDVLTGLGAAGKFVEVMAKALVECFMVAFNFYVCKKWVFR